jgi:phosphonate metabolism protein (transferase hexapeptide repeat family)
VTKLSETPLIHDTAKVSDCTIGKYTEIAERCRMSEVEFGDYSYIMEDGSVWCATIGKFANIASSVRINATNHPVWRPTLHHFTYRAKDYWPDADMDEEFFAWRRANRVVIGHDVWIGHGATILPGVKIGNGAVIGAGAVVSRDVGPYMIVAGVAAKPIRERFSRDIAEGFEHIAWWDWDHETLHERLADFRNLDAPEFLEKFRA